MAKAQVAPYLKSIQGSIEDLVTFKYYSERSTQVLEKKPIPTYTRTSKQNRIRVAYRDVVDAWNALSPSEKQSWDEQAAPLKLSGMNLYIREHIHDYLHLYPRNDLYPAEDLYPQ